MMFLDCVDSIEIYSQPLCQGCQGQECIYCICQSAQIREMSYNPSFCTQKKTNYVIIKK